MEQIEDNYGQLAREIIFCGIGPYESVLHFGACDNELNFIKQLDELQLDIQYTAVDSKDEVKTFFTDFEPMERTMPWISVQESMQEHIDNIDDERYNWTLITGVFDKPIYSERQYQYIDTVIKECFNFSDNVIFTLKETFSETFQYSMLYLFSHLVAEYETVTAKKLKDDQFIFHVTKQ
jgi:hypothetical protein